MAVVGNERQSPLQTDRGTTTISDAAVTSIASTAVQEVSGAEPALDTGRGGGSIPGDSSLTMGELFDRVTGSARDSRGVSVEVGETQIAIDLAVTEVNVTVKDVFFTEQR